MSRLDELIAELCPNGVEYIPLGEVLKNNNAPNSISKKYYKENGDIPIIDQSQVYIAGYTDDESAVPPILPCIIFGDHTRVVKYADRKFAQGDSGTKVFIPVTEDLNTKYIYYAFCNIDIQSRGYNRHWTIAKNIKIPLPPLPIQQEIVRILDNFTELTAELTARRKQYEYYRDLLLTDLNEDTVKWISLKECTLPTSNIKWSLEDESTTYKYIDLTSVDRELHYITETQEINKNNAPSRAQQIVKAGDILFATTRPLLKRYCLIDSEYDGQICSTGFCVLRANTDIVLQKWVLYHIASSSFYYHVEKYQQGASYPAISDTNVKDYRIPVPPIEEQERIVAILDRFDALCNDLTSGLPAEIGARQKQYEYYRDKLLTFKEIEK